MTVYLAVQVVDIIDTEPPFINPGSVDPTPDTDCLAPLQFAADEDVTAADACQEGAIAPVITFNSIDCGGNNIIFAKIWIFKDLCDNQDEFIQAYDDEYIANVCYG